MVRLGQIGVGYFVVFVFRGSVFIIIIIIMIVIIIIIIIITTTTIIIRQII